MSELRTALEKFVVDSYSNNYSSMATNLLTVSYLVRRLLLISPDDMLNTLDDIVTNNVNSFTSVNIGMLQRYWRGSLADYHFAHTLIGVARELGNKSTRRDNLSKVSPEVMRKFNIPCIEKVITHYSV